MKSFKTVQRQFSAHIKDPENKPFKRAEARRITIYRDLFFNNIVGFLDNSFPVLKSLYAREDWLALARAFFREHHCRSPYFVDISKEFVEFVAEEYQLTDTDPAFLAPLAHYEWLELDLSIRKGQCPDNSSKELSNSTQLGLSPLASLVSYAYPVHQIRRDFQPQQPNDTVFIVVYRNRDDSVEFILLNQVTAFLLDTIEKHPLSHRSAQNISYGSLLSALHKALPDMTQVALDSAMRSVLIDFAEKGVVSLD